MKLFIPNSTVADDKMFGEMCVSVTNKHRECFRSTGFMYQQKNGFGWFTTYPISMPAHLMPGFASKHHAILLRYNYICLRKQDGVQIELDNIKIFYPSGVFIPFRVYKDDDNTWKLFDYDKDYDGEFRLFGDGYDLLTKRGIPHFPKELMLDTFPKPVIENKKPVRDEDFHWKGLASQYIMA